MGKLSGSNSGLRANQLLLFRSMAKLEKLEKLDYAGINHSPFRWIAKEERGCIVYR
jgi:hypothetical protein